VKVTDILDVPFGMRFSPTDRKGIPHVQKTHTFNFYRVHKFKLNNGGKKSGSFMRGKNNQKDVHSISHKSFELSLPFTICS
jgi:hypothetical protein